MLPGTSITVSTLEKEGRLEDANLLTLSSLQADKSPKTRISVNGACKQTPLHHPRILFNDVPDNDIFNLIEQPLEKISSAWYWGETVEDMILFSNFSVHLQWKKGAGIF